MLLTDRKAPCWIFLGLLLLVRREYKNTHTLFAVSVLAPASSSSLTIKTCPFSTAWNNAVFLSWKENANSSCYKPENNTSLFSFRLIRISQNSFLLKKTMGRNKTCQFSLEPRTRTWRQTRDVTNLTVCFAQLTNFPRNRYFEAFTQNTFSVWGVYKP